jgi:hypothetical protein
MPAEIKPDGLHVKQIRFQALSWPVRRFEYIIAPSPIARLNQTTQDQRGATPHRARASMFCGSI